METRNEQQAKSLHVVVVNDKRFAVEERNGNISFNLTQMAKGFGKRPIDWLRFQPAKEYLEALSKVSGTHFDDLIETRQGGTPEKAGTWTNDARIAVRFAQWLNMDFAIAVDELVYKTLTGQAVVLEPKRGVMPIYYEHKKLYPYRDVIEKAFGLKRGSNVSRRKAAFPEHFVTIFGRNFITEHMFNLMCGYYDFKQLSLNL